MQQRKTNSEMKHNEELFGKSTKITGNDVAWWFLKYGTLGVPLVGLIILLILGPCDH